jgi:hypothetical protein
MRVSKSTLIFIFIVLLSFSAGAESAPYPRSVIIFDGFWLGSVAGGKWQSAGDVINGINEKTWEGQAQIESEYPFPYPWGHERYAIYDSDGYLCAASGEALHSDHPGEFGDDLQRIDIHTGDEQQDAALGTTVYLGISAGFEDDDEDKPAPRKAVALSVKNATYEKIVKEYLAKNGLPSATVNIMQLFRVDLEGDGVDEVVIYAQNIVDPKKHSDFWSDDKPIEEIRAEIQSKTEPGMYSVLLLRKIINRKVRDIPLASFISPKGKSGGPAPSVQRVYQFADLNGDGTLEIIMGDAYFEGYDYCVYKVQEDGTFEIVLRNGWRS